MSSTSTVLLKECMATRRVGLGASVWMSKIVLDFAYTEQHEIQKQTSGHRKVKCCVSKANPPWNFARKIEAIMSFKCAKKIKKETASSSAPLLPTKKVFGLRICKKPAESASAESKLHFCPPLLPTIEWSCCKLPKIDLTDGLHQNFPIYLNVFIFTQIWMKLFSFAQI